jgi:DNA-binding LacI/PurR family transcriptional regulator
VEPRSKLPLALLIDNLDDEYQVAVVRGALSAARDLGMSLLCVPGGRVRDTTPDRAARNVAFDLVNAETVSGVIAVSSVIGSAIGPGELTPWLRRFEGAPLCSVGVSCAGFASIEVENSTGIRDLVLHLGRDHGRKHIAFVRGPKGSVEANARYEAYVAALAELGSKLEPDLVVDGDFLKASGANAVRVLAEERGLRGRFGALVAANDYMALGAIEELWRRHLDVPNEVAVVGFDDVESARFSRPALTTARQPIELLGRRGVEAAAELAAGRKVPSASLPTKRVVRGSCGCSTTETGLAGSVPLTASRGVEISFVQRRHAILAEMSRAAEGRFGAAGSGWEARLLDALIGDLRMAGSTSFLRAFEQSLYKLARDPMDVSVLQDLLTALRRQSLPCVASVPGARDKLEDALHEARVLASVFSEEAGERRARVTRERQRSFEQGMRSVLFSDTAHRSAMAAASLPAAFGVDECVVAALTRPDTSGNDARILFGFGSRDQIVEEATTRLAALPAHAVFGTKSRAQVALPLTAGGHAVGMAIVGTSKAPDAELEGLREFLSTALDTLKRAAR